ncbi:hypothetical protein CYMTET_11544 [Cymbomonas tetramitiformis]|uniref:Uncharacterized protein n=1 Tax=Cymbomonas tetramitiformis TaxID=36881 RepID=A0AAE0LCR3_9CHLO|nr:hypothetical protein CYMTET_11544 [Cymbomonas tetramitiformis]
MLRCYVAENQEDWDLCVTPVEYAIADSVSAATGYSPFELVYGNAPATQLDVFMDAALEVRCGLGEPSSEQSKAKISGTPDFELADRRVLQRTRQIIEYCDPAYYFIRRTLLETRYEDCTREQ